MADRHYISNKLARTLADPDRLLTAVVITGVCAFMFVVFAAAFAS